MDYKYVVRFIPIDGEIEEGDWIYDKISYGKCLRSGSDGIEHSMFGGVHNPADYKRVKLFLCSRDIKLDDWLTCAKTGQEMHVDVHILGSIKEGLLPDDYKVIGEISPEAGWVSNNESIKETDVQFVVKEDNWYEEKIIPTEELFILAKTKDSLTSDLQPGKEWVFYSAKKYIKILNPHCKHFH